MASEKGGGLDPADMCRKHRDFSLSGSYRKLLARLGDDFGYQIKTYVNDNEQMVETDMERIMKPKSLPNSFNKIPLDNEDKMRDSVQLDARINKFTNADKSTAKIFAVEKPTNLENSPFNGLPGSAIKETFIQTASTEKRFERHEETDEATYSSASIDSKQTPTFSTVNAEFAASQSSSSLWKKNRSSTFQTNNEPAETSARLWKHKNTVFTNAAEPATSSIVATSAAVVATHDLPATKISISKPSTTETDESQSLETTDDEIIVFEGRDPTGQRVLKRQANEPFMDEAQTQKELDYVGDREPKKIAVIVKFQLASSQYATMALRELMSGGVQLYRADFGRGQRK
jgi:tRNA pseudouridine13 synthase